MPITEQEYKILIVEEVNDLEGEVADQIDLYWSMYSDQTDNFRRYLYVKRHALTRLLGAERHQVTIEIRDGNVQQAKSDFTKHLNNLLTWTQAQIDELERGATAVSSGWSRTPERA